MTGSSRGSSQIACLHREPPNFDDTSTASGPDLSGWTLQSWPVLYDGLSCEFGSMLFQSWSTGRCVDLVAELRAAAALGGADHCGLHAVVTFILSPNCPKLNSKCSYFTFYPAPEILEDIPMTCVCRSLHICVVVCTEFRRSPRASRRM